MNFSKLLLITCILFLITCILFFLFGSEKKYFFQKEITSKNWLTGRQVISGSNYLYSNRSKEISYKKIEVIPYVLLGGPLLWPSYKPLDSVDLASFEVLTDGFAKDNASLYYEGHKQKGVDVSSFEWMGDGYYKDHEAAYFKTLKLEVNQIKTLEYLGAGYLKDNKSVWKDGWKLKLADAETFVVKGLYGADKERFYYNTPRWSAEHSGEFHYIGNGVAHDGKMLWYKGRSLTHDLDLSKAISSPKEGFLSVGDSTYILESGLSTLVQLNETADIEAMKPVFRNLKFVLSDKKNIFYREKKIELDLADFTPISYATLVDEVDPTLFFKGDNSIVSVGADGKVNQTILEESFELLKNVDTQVTETRVVKARLFEVYSGATFLLKTKSNKLLLYSGLDRTLKSLGNAESLIFLGRNEFLLDGELYYFFTYANGQYQLDKFGAYKRHEFEMFVTDNGVFRWGKKLDGLSIANAKSSSNWGFLYDNEIIYQDGFGYRSDMSAKLKDCLEKSPFNYCAEKTLKNTQIFYEGLMIELVLAPKLLDTGEINLGGIQISNPTKTNQYLSKKVFDSLEVLWGHEDQVLLLEKDLMRLPQTETGDYIFEPGGKFELPVKVQTEDQYLGETIGFRFTHSGVKIKQLKSEKFESNKQRVDFEVVR